MKQQMVGEDFQDFTEWNSIVMWENSKWKVIAMWETQHGRIRENSSMADKEYDLE